MPESTSTNIREKVHSLQETLIEKAEAFLDGKSLPTAIQDAFFNTPRHNFMPRFQDGTPGLWTESDNEALLQYLDTLYTDQPYCIFRNEKGETTSTISQPSLVLFMLDLLDLHPGQSVFELGGGSGWNAALMGQLVGDKGKIISIEIESALASNAKRALSLLGAKNVSYICGDAYSEISKHESFDRGTFTASAWELPPFFFDKIKEDGLLLFVLKFTDETDLLILLRKKNGYFFSEFHFPCRFVPITGSISNRMSQTQSKEEHAFFDTIRTRNIDPEDLNLEIRLNGEPQSPSSRIFSFSRGECLLTWSIPN